jgi:hypothetical protein
VGTVSAATSSWALDRVDQRSLPLDSQYSFNPTSAGQGVDVYVVDSGTYLPACADTCDSPSEISNTRTGFAFPEATISPASCKHFTQIPVTCLQACELVTCSSRPKPRARSARDTRAFPMPRTATGTALVWRRWQREPASVLLQLRTSLDFACVIARAAARTQSSSQACSGSPQR